MTHLKIHKINFFVLVTFLLHIAICDESIKDKQTVAGAISPEINDTNEGDVSPGVHLNESKTKSPPESKNANKTDASEANSKTITLKTAEVNSNSTQQSGPQSTIGIHFSTFNSGALKRGFFVFVGLSALVMLYIVFRSFRLNRTRNQIVRKYGVLANRQDVEMRPLPLEEDDEDDTTVFDASNISTRNMHQ